MIFHYAMVFKANKYRIAKLKLKSLTERNFLQLSGNGLGILNRVIFESLSVLHPTATHFFIEGICKGKKSFSFLLNK